MLCKRGMSSGWQIRGREKVVSRNFTPRMA